MLFTRSPLLLQGVVLARWPNLLPCSTAWGQGVREEYLPAEVRTEHQSRTAKLKRGLQERQNLALSKVPTGGLSKQVS